MERALNGKNEGVNKIKQGKRYYMKELLEFIFMVLMSWVIQVGGFLAIGLGIVMGQGLAFTMVGFPLMLLFNSMLVDINS